MCKDQTDKAEAPDPSGIDETLLKKGWLYSWD